MDQNVTIICNNNNNIVLVHENLLWDWKSQYIQGDTKKRELLKNPIKIEEIQQKILLAAIEPLQLAI